jgi:hypothetical protein
MAENNKANALAFLKHLKKGEQMHLLQQTLLLVEFTLMMFHLLYMLMRPQIIKIISTVLVVPLARVQPDQL